MSASLQVLAGVRRAPAMVLFCHHGVFHPEISKLLASRGLFSHQRPRGASGRMILFLLS